jgi:hypothetical protein
MASNTRTTKIESVNTMLSTIGESPINTLTGTLPVDATLAINILDEVNREVQAQGWKFNSSYKVTLTRNTDNKIPIGNDVMHIEFNHLRENRSSYDPVLRGNFLYNLATESFIWDKNFDDVHIIYLLDFEDIIEQARRYITIRASRIFHDRTLGANALHRFSKEDEFRALSFLKQAEASTADHNIFDSLDQFKTVNRNGSLKVTS